MADATGPDRPTDATEAMMRAALDAALQGWPDGSLGRTQVLHLWAISIAYGRAAALAGTAPADRLRKAASEILERWDYMEISSTNGRALSAFAELRAALAVGAPAAPGPARQQCATEVTPGVRCQRKAGHPGSCVAHRLPAPAVRRAERPPELKEIRRAVLNECEAWSRRFPRQSIATTLAVLFDKLTASPPSSPRGTEHGA